MAFLSAVSIIGLASISNTASTLIDYSDTAAEE
jgi:hypothetical protein